LYSSLLLLFSFILLFSYILLFLYFFIPVLLYWYSFYDILKCRSMKAILVLLLCIVLANAQNVGQVVAFANANWNCADPQCSSYVFILFIYFIFFLVFLVFFFFLFFFCFLFFIFIFLFVLFCTKRRTSCRLC
jgi:hypothetical protein